MKKLLQANFPATVFSFIEPLIVQINVPMQNQFRKYE